MAGGQKILDGLRDAVAGNLAVTVIDGVVWVRKDLSRIAELEAALHAADIRLEQLGETGLSPVRMMIQEALCGRNA